MSKIRYQTTLALSEADQKRLEELQKKGMKVIDIFRKVVEIAEKAWKMRS